MNAPKFEDRSQEETEWREHWACEAVWTVAKKLLKIKEECKVKIKPGEREFLVDSEASMHMMSRMDLNFAQLENLMISRFPTTVLTAIGEVQTLEEVSYARSICSFFLLPAHQQLQHHYRRKVQVQYLLQHLLRGR